MIPDPGRDWLEWHRRYDEPSSALAQRLQVVQDHVRQALHEAPPGPVRVVSMCAGQGRDLLGVLAGHPRRDDVRARLVELDQRNVAIARQATADAGLPGVEVVAGDAALTDAYAGAVPAEVILACGVFGNISDDDVSRTVRYLPTLCAPGGAVIWTRHRRPPDLTPAVRAWFAERGFEEVAYTTADGTFFGVGTHRLQGTPAPLPPGRRLFTFLR